VGARRKLCFLATRELLLLAQKRTLGAYALEMFCRSVLKFLATPDRAVGGARDGEYRADCADAMNRQHLSALFGAGSQHPLDTRSWAEKER